MAATVSFRLNRPKEKDGQLKTIPCGILIKYYRAGIEIELSTGEKAIPANFTGTRVTRETKFSARINKILSDMENALLNIPYDKLIADEEATMVRAIVKRQSVLTEDSTQKKTSLFTVGRFLVQYKRQMDPKTVKRYRVLWGVLSRFQNGKRLDFSTMDMDFLDRFKNFLYDTPNPNYHGYSLVYHPSDSVYIVTAGHDGIHPIGLFDETVFKYIVQLKTVADWIADRGYPVHPARKDWKIINRVYPPISLTRPELERVEAMVKLGIFKKKIKTATGERTAYIDLDICRDYLSMECRTGQRISDLKRFKPDHIQGDFLLITQQKGNRMKVKNIRLPLMGFSSMAKLILQKYNYKLPYISEPYLNIGIKEVCRRAGITERIYIERWAGNKKIRIPFDKCDGISTHTGKKTFITILAGDGVPVKVISGWTGTSIKTIDRHYLGETDDEVSIKYMKSAEETKVNMKIA